ncbi:hypothetical protein OIU79_005106 [Salix purpurea]|uniref:Uncharacterized protein n=1 Tax=Salix purpurea TaxID=77065 RepID=A0A9Q0ZAF6_SALPP|nr:hypothetical protein OIU79_005106 [Salix purpurea]
MHMQLKTRQELPIFSQLAQLKNQGKNRKFFLSNSIQDHNNTLAATKQNNKLLLMVNCFTYFKGYNVIHSSFPIPP